MNEVIVRDQRPQHTFAELEKMSSAVAKSGLFGVKTQDQALALMLLAQAEGLHPAIAARDYHIIEGKPSLKADTMLARFQQAGGTVEWHELTDVKADATFTPPHGKPLRMDWDIDRAKTAGLVRNNRDGSAGMWVKYPRGMLRSRLVSEGIRTVCPGVIAGVYTVDEIRDGIAEEIIDVTTIRDTDPTVIAEVIAAMPESDVLAHKAAIEGAPTIEDLKRVHAVAYRAAHAIGDTKALSEFETIKESVKLRLAPKAAA